jgi:RNA polymerase sigma-70 factor (ECF subfamily)
MARSDENMDERRAIELCIAHRDPIGFEFLVRKYQREAYMHAIALVGNRDDAAEACQESFASAFASLPRLSELTAFYPWFYRVLRNRCLNMLARRRTAAAYARGSDGDEPLTPSPEFLFGKQQEQAQVWRTLRSLKVEFREILALKYLLGYDYAALAALLGIPRGTVMSRLYHARKAFHAAYLGEGGAQAHDRKEA